LQLAITTVGDMDSPLVFLIVIAPSPAVATSSFTSNLANPLIFPLDTDDMSVCSGEYVALRCAVYLSQLYQREPLTFGIIPNTPVDSQE
jgi:hypothetical protein